MKENLHLVQFNFQPVVFLYFIIEKYNGILYFFYGNSEGGPAFDQVVGKIESIKKEADNKFILYYHSLKNINSVNKNCYVDLSEKLDFSKELFQIRIEHNKSSIQFSECSEKGANHIPACSLTKLDELSNNISYDSYINDNHVRVRTKPSLLGDILFLCNKDEAVHIIERTKNKQNIDGIADYWYFIENKNSKQGWVFGFYISSGKKENSIISQSADVITIYEK